jgi:hypothetical protein
VVVQRVEGVEERLLRLGPTLQELDVVDEQDVDLAVPGLEGGAPVVRDRVDEVVGEFLTRHVSDLHPGVEGLRVVADGVQEVGLAETGVAVDEERVVGLRGSLGDGDGGRVRESVGLTDDEVVERVLGVEARLVAQRSGLLHGGLDAHGILSPEVRNRDRRGRLLGEFVVDDDAERRDLVADVRQRLHDGEPQALVDLRRGEVVRHVEVEGRRHHTGRHRKAQEPLQLGSDAVIVDQQLLHRGPDRDVGLGR